MNKELLFNLIKKMESREIKLDFDGEKIYFSEVNQPKNEIIVGKIKGYDDCSIPEPYNEEWNKEFKKNFYKEKGLDKCWVKDCSNKIYQTKDDYKKVRVQCQDKHTRMVCLEHAPKLEMEGKCPNCKRELTSLPSGECRNIQCLRDGGYIVGEAEN